MKTIIYITFSLLLLGCAPSKHRLISMSNYELCDWIYKTQRSLDPSYQKYYWGELHNRNVYSCNQYENQIRQADAASHQNIMNFFNALAVGAAVSGSSTPINPNINSTTNNIYVTPRTLPPVIITPPQGVPSKR